MVLSDFSSVAEESVDFASQKLSQGKLDALFFTGAFPNPTIQKNTKGKSLKFLSLGGRVKSTLKSSGAFIDMVLPKNTYSSVMGSSKTLGVTALLLTHANTPDDKILRILDVLYKKTTALANKNIQARYINPEQYRSGVSIPFHPAVEKYFTNN